MSGEATHGAVRQAYRRIRTLAAAALFVIVAGTAGYRVLSEGVTSWLDCLYMTVITVTTIGYGEVVDLTRHPGAVRAFSMLVAVSGIGIITYAIGSLTSFAVDGELRAILRRRRMQKTIRELRGHHILAGWSGVARSILRELLATGRPAVVIAPDAAAVREAADDPDGLAVIEGDVTADELLQEAGIEHAGGVFAATDDDHTNIIVCLSARRLNASARIVSAVREEENAVKMRRAGANATVSVVGIGGLRMASEMVRPTVVTFLDTMLRSTGPTLRVEEVPAGPSAVGRRIADLGLDACGASLLLAVRCGDQWRFKPPADGSVREGDVLVFMTTPADLDALRSRLGA
ncbi:MAG: potassium transporter TrkA [Lentisphaerae bacterium]|nr:potassium transporter TrkA [Lentisphaerota bacterium]